MKNPNANVVRAKRTNKANVPADLQSAGIEYKDLFNPITSHLTNVPADLHELLSTAKNLPELSIRTEGQRS